MNLNFESGIWNLESRKLMRFQDLYNHLLNDGTPAKEPPFPVRSVSFEKNAVITKYDEVEQNLYFIQSGIVELKIKSYTSEKVLDFFFANEMVTCFTSFLLQIPSDTEMTAIVSCEMEAIAYSDLQKAYRESLPANRVGRMLTEQAYLRKAQREKDLLAKTAEERYAELLESQGEYVSQIPVNKLAKYLGIHPESLSRIRKKLNS